MFLSFFFLVRRLYTQPGPKTHVPQTKSRMLYPPNQPAGTPIIKKQFFNQTRDIHPGMLY